MFPVRGRESIPSHRLEKRNLSADVYTGGTDTDTNARGGSSNARDSGTNLYPTTYIHAHIRTLSSTAHAHTGVLVEQRNREAGVSVRR